MSIEATARHSFPLLDVETRLSAAIVETAQKTREREEASEKAQMDALHAHQDEALHEMSDAANLRLAAGIVSGGMQMAAAGANITSGATLSTANKEMGDADLKALQGVATTMSAMGTASDAGGALCKAGLEFVATQSEMRKTDADHKADASQMAMKQHERRADEAQANTQKALDQFAELVRARAAMNLAAVRG